MPQEHAVHGTDLLDETFPSLVTVPAPGVAHLLSKKELAGYLGVTVRTVEEYQRRGLPYFRLSARRNRYDLMTVRAWLGRECRAICIL